MKSPLWILNASLVFFLLLAAILMYFWGPQVPPPTSLIPKVTEAPRESELAKVNVARIYENDPFNTFVKVGPLEEEKKAAEVLIPQPPVPLPEPEPKESMPEFLPPLSVQLKGVIYNSNPIYGRVVLANAKSGDERLYKLGDMVEDATIVHVGKNKVVFVRSNGQQEAVFLSPQAAQKDAVYMGDRDWHQVIEKVGTGIYKVDTRLFKNRVKSVAQLIDMLDITTAFEDGKSLGCRIGQISSESLGGKLGFKYDDIITKINGISAIGTKDRVKIYQSIAQAGPAQNVTVECIRDGATKRFTYALFASEEDGVSIEAEVKSLPLPAGTPLGRPTLTPPRNEKLVKRAIETNARHENIANDYQRRDQKSMLEYGGRDALLQR